MFSFFQHLTKFLCLGTYGEPLANQMQQMRLRGSGGRQPYPLPPATYFGCGHHEPMTGRENREIRWLDPRGEAFRAIFKTLTDTGLCNTIKRCYKGAHTSELESYHSTKLWLLPKQCHFGMLSTVSMTELAILRHNQRILAGRGTEYDSLSYSRAQNKYTAKLRHVYDHSPLHRSLLSSMMEGLDTSIGSIPDAPDTFHGVPKPTQEERDELFRVKRSRLA